MFRSIYSAKLSQYFNLRESVLSKSAREHELCYLRRFDTYVYSNLDACGDLSEDFINGWISTLSGKSGSIENEVIVIRQFLKYLALSGEKVFLPAIPKVHDDYIPYIFSDDELAGIFQSADNIVQKGCNADPYLEIEFPVILRLLYSCGLRIGETVKLRLSDIDFENGILKLLNTKGDKHRLVPMASDMSDILSRYCMAMDLNKMDDLWLFPSSLRDSHISDRAIKRRFEIVLKENNIRLANRKKYERGPCLHCFRHVFAFKSFSQAESKGHSLDDTVPYLSIYLGHESLNETSKYLKFSNEMFPESIYTFGEFMNGLIPEVDYEA